MIDEHTTTITDHIALTGEIVAAYVSNNPVRPVDVPALIASVHATVAGLVNGGSPSSDGTPIEKPTPAQIRKSISQDGIISFLDGKTYKTLKRHLTANGLTPERYRERYGLPSDYPMLCAAYSERRSSLAKSIGLGVPGGRPVSGAKKGQSGKTA